MIIIVKLYLQSSGESSSCETEKEGKTQWFDFEIIWISFTLP